MTDETQMTDDELFLMVKSFLCYLAWEKKYNFNSYTFQQIILQNYQGIIDEAIEYYLMKIIKEININQFFAWLYQKGIDTTEEDCSKLYLIMQRIVFDYTVEEIKEIIGMIEVCIK
jgi:hypothetical protein